MTRKDQADEFMGAGRAADLPPAEILRQIGDAIRLGRHKPGQGRSPTEAALVSSFGAGHNAREAIARLQVLRFRPYPAGSRRSLHRGAAGFRIAPDSPDEPATRGISARDSIIACDATRVHPTGTAARIGRAGNS